MSDKRLKVVKNIDPSTGEIHSQEQRYYEPSLNEEGYKVPSHKAGAKVFEGVSFPEGMTDSEVGKMTRLAKSMIPFSNMLGYRARGSILPYTEKHLISMVGLSPKRGRQFVKKMIEMGVIKKVVRKHGGTESTEHYINPAYFFAGRRISFNLYLLFREHLDPILPTWVKQEFLKMASSFSDKANR